MRAILLILLLIVPLKGAYADDGAIAEIERLEKRITALGDVEGFATKVALAIASDDCRSLVSYIGSNSIYKSDPEHFYASCVYHSRRFVDLSDFSIGRRSYAVVTPDRSPPFMPKIVIDYVDGAKIEVGLDLSGSDFRIIELSFYVGGKPKVFYPPWVRLQQP